MEVLYVVCEVFEIFCCVLRVDVRSENFIGF